VQLALRSRHESGSDHVDAAIPEQAPHTIQRQVKDVS